VVILIGGVSCTGKTVMAQKLLELYKTLTVFTLYINIGII